jgi:BirA family transcriptional regulator, biotin operon repressor / biotin---[acetyl-CoA-carboxylase] ligase
VNTDLPARPPLDPATVAERVVAVDAGRWRAQVLAASPSTNAVVAGRVRAGEAEGLVVVADHQTAGRGRLDRSWVTPAGAALTFSLLLTPDDVPLARWPWLPLLTGVAVVEAVRRVTGAHVVLKWPNDVLAAEAGTDSGTPDKLAGILVERVEGPRGAAAVVGVGLNVSQTAEELPVPHATSVAAVSGGPVDRVDLLVAVLESLSSHYDAWRAAGGDAARGLHETYSRLCATVGWDVRVQLPDGSDLVGEAVGVDPEGRLLVTSPSGTTALGAGDVVHVRRR